MDKQQTFASAAWTRKGKVTRRERFLAEMDAVWKENQAVYGARKVWKQMKREG